MYQTTRDRQIGRLVHFHQLIENRLKELERKPNGRFVPQLININENLLYWAKMELNRLEGTY